MFHSHCLSVKAVHPRVCGELSGGWLKEMSVTGSSPRVWGTLWLLSFDNAGYFSIETINRCHAIKIHHSRVSFSVD